MKFTFSLSLNSSVEDLKNLVAKEMRCKPSQLKTFRIIKRSVDARHKNAIKLVYTVEASKGIEQGEVYSPPTYHGNLKYRPIVIGFGPAGIFSAYALAKAGLCPIVLERGADVDKRREVVKDFFQNRNLDENTNVQFGEGGAGTFSDGKLNTGIGDKEKLNYVLQTFVNHGAPAEILYEAKPHVGTDKLGEVVKGIRNEIKTLGGEVFFNVTAENFIQEDDGVTLTAGGKNYKTDALVLAIGHSADDTYRELFSKGYAIEGKAFSVGFRIEHLQSEINKSLYGDFANHPALGAADYKLVNHVPEGSAYSFCMCPGGEVVASSSSQGTVVTNGMSVYARNGKNANSAILVGVDGKDFGNHPLDGLKFRDTLEKKAFVMGGENYNAPCQLLGDFLEDKKSSALGKVSPTYLPGVTFSNLNQLFSPRINQVFKKSFSAFERKIKGFSAYDSLLTGVETRSSAPLRILRNEGKKSITNPFLYPCGEGCGYAGGIMSAAVDGLKVAESIILGE